jgi:hypothetical protein
MALDKQSKKDNDDDDDDDDDNDSDDDDVTSINSLILSCFTLHL